MLLLGWQNSTHLKKRSNLNQLTNEELEAIWVPVVTFSNTESKKQSIKDKRTFASVKRQGKEMSTEITNLENRYEFKGGENLLEITRNY